MIFCQSARVPLYGDKRIMDLGEDKMDVAHNLFYFLREADRRGATSVYFEDIGGDGIGLAIKNRIIRAAGFDVLNADKEEEIEEYIVRLHR